MQELLPETMRMTTARIGGKDGSRERARAESIQQRIAALDRGLAFWLVMIVLCVLLPSPVVIPIVVARLRRDRARAISTAPGREAAPVSS